MESEGKGERPMTWRWRGESGKKRAVAVARCLFFPGGLCLGDPARSIATMPAQQKEKPVAQKKFYAGKRLRRQLGTLHAELASLVAKMDGRAHLAAVGCPA